MKKWFFAVFFLSFIVTVVQFGNNISSASVETSKAYMLELDRWGISNDGTHPNETTKGINNALI